jgi:hypothetical protein
MFVPNSTDWPKRRVLRLDALAFMKVRSAANHESSFTLRDQSLPSWRAPRAFIKVAA